MSAVPWILAAWIILSIPVSLALCRRFRRREDAIEALADGVTDDHGKSL
jgi:hypothetical protein